MIDPAAVAIAVRALAAAEGFVALGFAAVEPLGIEGARLDAWLGDGFGADMAWMGRSREARLDPRRLLPGAATVVVLSMPCAPARPDDPGGLTGRVARYAWGRDYHAVLGASLHRVQRALADRFPGLSSYASVDSGPVFERAWAARAGVGFPGRSCFQIVPGWGPGVLLAALLLDLALPPTPPIAPACEPCARCLRDCPTGALVAAGRLDARRCLSYLTIEHRGDIPAVLRPALGRRVFGCDTCQETCPHERPGRADPTLAGGRAWLDLEALLLAEDDALRHTLAGSPLRRTGAVGLKRNACVVLGNMADPRARTALGVALAHASPIVRRHAGWAAARCGMRSALAAAFDRERDPPTRAALGEVLAESG